MYNYLFKELIERFKNQEVSAFEMIYDEFKRLINFYARKLAYEDASGELTLFLIELIYSPKIAKFPCDKTDSLQRYIAVAIRNKYIELSKKKSRENSFCLELCEWDGSENNFINKLQVEEALGHLTERQRNIILYKYVYGFSDCQIAKMLSITRQSVNRLKNRGLKELKNYYGVQI